MLTQHQFYNADCKINYPVSHSLRKFWPSKCKVQFKKTIMLIIFHGKSEWIDLNYELASSQCTSKMCHLKKNLGARLLSQGVRKGLGAPKKKRGVAVLQNPEGWTS